jgi:hypothetical protein
MLKNKLKNVILDAISWAKDEPRYKVNTPVSCICPDNYGSNILLGRVVEVNRRAARPIRVLLENGTSAIFNMDGTSSTPKFSDLRRTDSFVDVPLVSKYSVGDCVSDSKYYPGMLGEVYLIREQYYYPITVRFYDQTHESRIFTDTYTIDGQAVRGLPVTLEVESNIFTVKEMLESRRLATEAIVSRSAFTQFDK